MRGVLALVVLSWPLTARADEVAARLSYERAADAASCPDEAAMRDAVSARVGYPVFDRSPATRVVTVTLVRVRRELRAHVEVRDDAGVLLGSRDLSSPSTDCAELASAITLAISISLDPSRLFGQGPTAAPSPVSTPASICAPVPPAAPCPACNPPPLARAPDDPIVPAIGAGVALAVGAAPAPSPVVVLDAELAWSRFALGVEAILDFGATADATPPPARLRTQLTLALARVCARAALGSRFVLAGCAVAGGGALHAASEGIASPGRELRGVVAVGLRAILDFRVVEHFFVRARLDAIAMPLTSTINLDGAPTWTSSPVAGLAGLELLVDFP